MPRYPIRGLRVRIALAVAASNLIVFGVAAGGIYLTLSRSWRAEQDRRLIETVDAARGLFAVDRPEFRTLEATVSHIVTELIFGDRIIVAVSPQRSILGVSRPLGGARLPAPNHFVDIGDTIVTVPTEVGRFRAVATSLEGGSRVVVGLSLFAIEHRLDELAWVLVAALLVCLAIGTSMGIALAGRALIPLSRLADMADRLGTEIAEDGKRIEIVQSSRVADEVGRVEAAFSALAERLRSVRSAERDAAINRRQFFADAAHELRTPVAILQSEIETALARNPAEPAGEVLERLAAETGHMGRLVGDLLLLARDELAAAPMTLSPFYLDDVVGRAVIRAGKHPLARSRRIVVGSFESVPVEGDIELIERAVMALLENALLHADPGDITVNVAVIDGRAAVQVADLGPILSEEFAARIFERFVRGNRQVPGSGLGLAIVRWIAIRHGGEVVLEQDPDRRSKVFSFRLPVREAD